MADPRFGYTHHLVTLVAEIEAAAARLAGADPDRVAARELAARREAARLSARLDASPLTEESADAVDRRLADGLPPVEGAGAPDGGRPRGAAGWARVLKLDAMATQDVAAVEYANLLAAAEAEGRLAQELFEAPLPTLQALHGEIVAGLVEPGLVGQLRRTEQAVHDGAQGQVIHRAPQPEALPARVEELCAWLGRGSAPLPAVLVAGIVHERLLELQPFEAGNGRVARSAARLVLRARGLDPRGLAVVERTLAADALGYHREVAATVRRRGDLGAWLERLTEAYAAAFAHAAAEVDPRPAPSLPRSAIDGLSALPEGGTITVAEYAERQGVSRERARANLLALTAIGAVHVVPGTRGLMVRRPTHRPAGQA